MSANVREWAGTRRCRRLLVIGAALMSLGGCASLKLPAHADSNARLSPPTHVTRDLLRLPPPRGKVVAAVYGFRDQTGQYKAAPDSSFSTSVTQGAASMLVKALKDSGWFTPVERENLQDLLTERKIVRAIDGAPARNPAVGHLPPLLPATILIEGGIVGYESNVRTGGLGARYLGVGVDTQYRVDQVTVILRSVDIRSGQILNSVSTTKTIYSYQLSNDVFRFVNFKKLLEVEGGYTRNEPAQLCVREVIESAVVHLIVQGLQDKVWALRNDKDWKTPVLQAYLKEDRHYLDQVGAGGMPWNRPAPDALPDQPS